MISSHALFLDQNMILDTLPHHRQSPITVLRILFGIAILDDSYTLHVASPVFAAGLFPFTPYVSQDKATDYTHYRTEEDSNRLILALSAMGAGLVALFFVLTYLKVGRRPRNRW